MYTINEMTTFADFLRQRMQDMNLNNKGVASLAGVSPSVVGDWLKGTLPRAETLIQLAASLHADPGYLFHLAYGLPLNGTEEVLDPEVEDMLQLYRQLDDAGRQELLDLALIKLERAKRGKSGAETAKPK